MTSNDELISQVMQKLAASTNMAAGANRDQLADLQQIVERRLSGNHVWSVAFRGFMEHPTDVDLRANLEFILRRVASSDPDFLEEIDRSLGLRPPAVAEPRPTSSVQIDLKGSKNKVRDIAGRDINKSRTLRIGTAGFLALALLGGGSYTVYRVTNSGPGQTITALPAPIQLTPANGAVFSRYPRTTTFTWQAVPGAARYFLVVQACQLNSCTQGTQLSPLERTIVATSFTFDFVGGQPGRWRVAAVGPNGQHGPFSPWWGFKYTE